MELLILLAILQVGDILTTLRFMKAGVPEANPVLRKLFDEFGSVPVLILIKVAFLGLVFLAMGEPYWEWIVGGFCVVYAGVVVHNWRAVK